MSTNIHTLFLEIFTEKTPQSCYVGEKYILEKINKSNLISIHREDVYYTPHRLVIYLEFTQRAQRIKGPKTSCSQHVLEQFIKKYNAQKDDLDKVNDTKETWYLNQMYNIEHTIQTVVHDILAINWAESMNWGPKQAWPRPIRNVCLIVNELPYNLYLEDLQCHTNNQTFISLYKDHKIAINNFDEYKSKLLEYGILLSYDERYCDVKKQINALYATKNPVYTNRINRFCKNAADFSEKPIIAKGLIEIKDDIRKLPQDIICIATQQDYQVYCEQGIFLFCTDGVISNVDKNSKAGFERALLSRINEVHKLWTEDINRNEEYYHSQLSSKMIFKDILGSLSDRGIRISTIMQNVLDNIQSYCLDSNHIGHRKTHIEYGDIKLSEVGLVTKLSNEFDNVELLLSSYLMRSYGKNAISKILLHSHYLMHNDDDIDDNIAYVFTIIRCLDILVGLIGVSVKATGSSDRLGIKNMMNTVLKMNIKTKLNIKILVNQIVSLYIQRGIKLDPNTAQKVIDFLYNRAISELKHISRNWQYISRECIECGLSFTIMKQLDDKQDLIKEIEKKYRRLSGMANANIHCGENLLSGRMLSICNEIKTMPIMSVSDIMLCLDKALIILDEVTITSLNVDQQNSVMNIFKDCVVKINRIITI